MSEHPRPILPVYPPSCFLETHDRLLHFSRCVKFEDRARFIQDAPKPLRQRIEHMLSRVESVRHRIEAQSEGGFWITRLGEHLGGFRHHQKTQQPRPSPPAIRGWRASSTDNLRSALSTAAHRLGVSHHKEFISTPVLTGQRRGEEALGGRGTGSVYKGVNAGVVYFQNALPYSHPKAVGGFPRQTVPVAELLSSEPGKSLLSEPCKDGMIRWLHLPANNMAWVEEAIARHFNEKRPSRDELFGKPKGNPRTHEVLRRAVWRGHSREQSEPYTASHSRHLDPGCEVVRAEDESGNDNMILFTPFLHWETMANWLKECKSIEDQNRRASTKRPYLGAHDSVEDNFYAELRGHHQQNQGLDKVARKALRSSTNRFRHITQPGRTRADTVGRILFCAAKLAVLMMSFEDDELIRENLSASPPLHPRRSLHQAFCKYADFIPNAEELDKKQVVYKATAPVPSDSAREPLTPGLPRILMVDQLWLFVLDKNTVITAFPQRWGCWFVDDPSGVHRRICERLGVDGKREVASAYDLVLIIFDICCRVFYENVDFPDRQPLVNYILASSVNFLVAREMAARRELTRLARRVWETYDSPDNTEIAEAHKDLLNINPEAGLLRQAECVLHDLKIIRQIKSVQQKVLKQFHLQMAKMVIPAADLEGGGTSRLRSLVDVRKATVKVAHDEMLSGTERSAALWTLGCADDFEIFFEEQYQRLDSMHGAAKLCLSKIKELLDSKHTYACIISAWESAANSIELSNQGKSIMLFSVLSIIFLPLSFMGSLFGMNAVDYSLGFETFEHELRWIFGLSAIVIVIALVLAFDKGLLALVLYCWSVPTQWIATRAAMYEPGLFRGMRDHRKLDRKRVQKLYKMEEELERVRQDRETTLFWRKVTEDQEAKREAQRLRALREGRPREGLGV
ncbi:magnesium transport protein cora [Podospora conica]|nr:magnesium transport protein cora [Schizothecium conicum]